MANNWRNSRTKAENQIIFLSIQTKGSDFHCMDS